MSQPKILIACSNYYKNLAEKHLANCLKYLECFDYDCRIEIIEAGAYEIPAVIQYYHQRQPFDGYISLGLLLKGQTDHYEFIWQHIKECFIQFTLNGLIIGNGVITASSKDILTARVENGERVEEAVDAVDYLIRLSKRLKR